MVILIIVVGYLDLLPVKVLDGKIFCSSPTISIAKLILLDSAKIQEEETERANKKNSQKHEIGTIIYCRTSTRSFPIFRSTVKHNQTIQLDAEISAKFFGLVILLEHAVLSWF